MADILSKNGNTLFPELLVSDVVNKVRGKSSLAVLSNATPLAFNGNKLFTFTLDKEMDIVGENDPKTKGGATVVAKTINPLKVEYGVRISDEFMYASEEAKIDMLRPLSEGFAAKMARALDIMAFHGLNPRTAQPSTNIIGDNHFDHEVSQIVTRTAGVDADGEVEAAIAMVEGSDHEVNGMAMAPSFKSDLAALKVNGQRLYPDLAWGNAPGTLNGLKIDSNNTVSFNNSDDLALVGDFQNMFRWGYAKEMPIEVIQYGNPDNDAQLGDLKGHNQVYVRIEAYLGWGILDANAFAMIKAK